MVKDKDQLNEKQEAFCQLYISDKEFFGNWVQAYIEVYKPDESKPNWYKSACASSSRLLSNAKVSKRLSELLQKEWLNEWYIEKQLLFLITQFSDFSTKLSAIKHFDNLNARLEKAKQKALNNKEITTDVLTIKLPE
jgi:hypothetical protein